MKQIIHCSNIFMCRYTQIRHWISTNFSMSLLWKFDSVCLADHSFSFFLVHSCATWIFHKFFRKFSPPIFMYSYIEQTHKKISRRRVQMLSNFVQKKTLLTITKSNVIFFSVLNEKKKSPFNCITRETHERDKCPWRCKKIFEERKLIKIFQAIKKSFTIWV